MAQRKKKPKTQQTQKHLAVQYRANFFRKIKFIIDSICGADIYPLIPQRVLDEVYLYRCTPFRFTAECKSNITSKHLADVKVILSSLFKNKIIKIPLFNLEITLSEFYTVYYTIKILQMRISNISFTNDDKVKEALQIIADDDSALEEATKHMYSILYVYNFGECDLRKMLYWYRHDFIFPKTFPVETKNIITVNSATVETITVKVDGNARPAIRVGWAFAYTGVKWLSLNPSALGLKSPFPEIPLKVYIQSHAINRLLERIDCFLSGFIQFNTYCSLASPIIAHDTNNNLLIEFHILDTKAGYFRADIVEGILLIRTFLFITNTGTPEGQLLEKNTGLQKLDKKYLAIDKLSTFMTTDIDKNDEIQRIFRTSGCQCLLDLYEKMKPLVTKHANGFDSELMLKYITVQNFSTIENNPETS